MNYKLKLPAGSRAAHALWPGYYLILKTDTSDFWLYFLDYTANILTWLNPSNFTSLLKYIHAGFRLAIQ